MERGGGKRIERSDVGSGVMRMRRLERCWIGEVVRSNGVGGMLLVYWGAEVRMQYS